MRYKFHYFIVTCHSDMKPPRRKHYSLRFLNLRFVFMPFMTQLGSVWKNKVRSLDLTSRDIVIVQTGAWDLSKFELDQVMNEHVIAFKVALKRFRDELNKSHTPLFLITQPPFPDRKVQVVGRGNKNNVAIAAVNTLIVSTAVDLGVAVHDEFSLLLPRQDENVCASHYLCRTSDESRTLIGKAGVASLRLFAKCLCSNCSIHAPQPCTRTFDRL